MNKHLLIVGLLAVGLPLTAGAWSTNYVDVGRSGLSLNTGTNWANAYTNLGDALAVSWTNDRVWVAAGTYYPTNGTNRGATFNVRKQVSIYGGFTNGGSMADRNWNANVTVLSGDIGLPNVNTDNSYNVVTAIGNWETIDGFTIRDGYNADTVPPPYTIDKYGAGISCHGSIPSNILNCTFFNNAARYAGGAIYMGKILSGGGVLISNCLFVGNSVPFTGSEGDGAIGVRPLSTVLTITHCNFYDNYCISAGGAVHLQLESGAGACVVKQCRFVGNRAGGNGGALFYGVRSAYYRTRNCLLAGNTGAKGGGIYFHWTSDDRNRFETENCTLVGNYGAKGGAVYLLSSIACLTNNILWDNVSLNNADGNGMFIASAGTAYVGYVCSQGGLVYPAVSNAGALYDQGGNITGDPLFATNLYSGTWKTDAVYSSNTMQTVLTDTGAAWPVNGLAGYVVNPHVGDRASGSNYRMFHIVTNSATSLTVWGDAAALGTNASSYAVNDYHLPANSSCVNKGMNQDWMTNSVDLDGRMRLRYGAVDMGAYECIYKGTVFGFR